MDKEIKVIIKKIVGCDVTTPIDTFGDIIAPVLFKTDQSALFVNSDNNMSVLFPITIKDSERQKYILRLVELLSVLNDLEKNHLIYVQVDNGDDVCLFYEGKTSLQTEQIPHKIRVAQDVTLNLVDLENVILERNDAVMMTSTSITSLVSSELSRYICGSVYPTNSLAEYVKRGFKTEVERSTRLGLRYSIFSMFIAVIIAAVSPILSVMVSNSKGFLTIKQSQMDSLVQTAKPVYIVHQEDNMRVSNQRNSEHIKLK